MSKRWLVVGAVLLLAAPLVLLLRDFTREVLLVQLYRVAWTLRLVFETLPQTPLWFLFLAVVAFLAVRSLLRQPRPRRPTEAEVEHEGQLHRLVRWIEQAREGEYFRWSLSRQLGELALDVLAHEQRAAPGQIRRRLRAGELDAPPEVLACLEAGLRPAYLLPRGFLDRLRPRLLPGAEPPPDPALEAVVRYLETQLEVDHDR